MRKKTIILLTVLIMLLLCACSKGEGGTENAAVEDLFYYRVDMKSRYPLGMNAVITGLSASGDAAFVCGNRDGEPVVGRVSYTVGDGELGFGDEESFDLPGQPDGSLAVNLTYLHGQVYVLLGVQDEQSRIDQYSVVVYLPDGSLSRTVDIEYDGEEPIDHILVRDNGDICLRNMHSIRLYSADGEPLAAYDDNGRQLFYPILFGNEIFVQYAVPDSRALRLARLDPDSGELSDVDTPERLLGAASVSVCGSCGAEALINTGASLVSINERFDSETVIDWGELVGKSGQAYKYIYRVGGDAFLLVTEDSAELTAMTREYRQDTRTVVRVGVYGSFGGGALGMLEELLGNCDPDHRIECIGYGGGLDEEDRLDRLLLDAADGELDIVISDGYQIDPGAGFADLYGFIDTDSELSRESFPQWMLAGLERNGELKEIWGSYEIKTWTAYGPLAENPNPLGLKACIDYLDDIGYYGLKLDKQLTKETMLRNLGYNILEFAYDEDTDSYDLSTPQIMELMELCAERPLSYEFSEALDDPASEFSDVLVFNSDPQLLPMQYLNDEGISHRFFDGSDGGESLTRIGSSLRSCYMIPEAAPDKESSWSFLRRLLTEEWQVKRYAEWCGPYPSNIGALNTVLESYATEETAAEYYSLVRGAVLCNYEKQQLHAILCESILPYLYGDSDLETALKYAQGRINIYCAEHER